MTDPVASRKNIVLVVDDEQIILRLATTAIAEAGFRAAVAENGVAGLECYLKLKDEICLVLADVLMPWVDGIEMAERILEIEPNAKIVLMSGYSDAVLQTQKRNPALPFIRKPFLSADLVQKIRSVIGAAAAAG
jgi:two-component system cell cycle sensor histidine kinase/response regulator CckA